MKQIIPKSLLIFLASILSTSLGIGGGIILVPGFIFLNIEAKKAIPLSLLCILIIGFFGSIQHLDFLMYEFDYKLIYLIPGGILGAIFGCFCLKKAKNKFLTGFIIFYFTLVGLIMFFNIEFSSLNIATKPLYLFVAGFLMCTVSTLVGIGGGGILIPVLIYVFNIKTKSYVPISIAFMVFNKLTASLINLKNKLVDIKILYLAIPIALIGTIIGKNIYNVISADNIKQGVGGLLLLNAIFIIIKSILAKK
jgi:uncharacterized protein